MELNGIEPSASRVRCENMGRQCKDFAGLERQETSENASERPILATCRQNSEEQDAVAERLAMAEQAWLKGHDSRELRKALLAIIGLLDE